MSAVQALDQLDAFHERRRSGIGATDAAPILGVSRWATPYDVWEEKVGLAPPKVESIPMLLGKRLQEVVAQLFTDATGQKLRADRRHHRHPTHEWQVCHLDYRYLGNPKALVECKTTFSDTGWGPNGAGKVPVDVYVQCQHEMAVTGANSCEVACLIGHRDFRIYPILRDDSFIEQLTAAEESFWSSYVLTETPPPVDGSSAARRFLDRRHPTDDGVVLPATPEQEQFVNRYRVALNNLAAVEAARDELRNKIIEMIGDQAGLVGRDFEITYRRTKDSSHTDWKLVATYYERFIGDIVAHGVSNAVATAGLAGGSAEDVFALAASLYTTKKPGVRRFLWDDRAG